MVGSILARGRAGPGLLELSHQRFNRRQFGAAGRYDPIAGFVSALDADHAGKHRPMLHMRGFRIDGDIQRIRDLGVGRPVYRTLERLAAAIREARTLFQLDGPIFHGASAENIAVRASIVESHGHVRVAQVVRTAGHVAYRSATVYEMSGKEQPQSGKTHRRKVSLTINRGNFNVDSCATSITIRLTGPGKREN